MRVLVVATLLVAVGVLTLLHRRRVSRGSQLSTRTWRLPDELTAHGGVRGDVHSRVWVVFTTPMCATCGPVLDHLRRVESDAEVVAIDATTRPDLVEALEVRAAPTVLRAGHDGYIDLRLSGPAAATEFFAIPTG